MVFRSGDSFDCALRARRQPSPRCRICGCTGDCVNYAIYYFVNYYATYYATYYYAIYRGFRGRKLGCRCVG